MAKTLPASNRVLLVFLLEWMVLFGTQAPAPLQAGSVVRSTSPSTPMHACESGDLRCWSGVHLGNRVSDWSPSLFQYLKPPNGHWPAAVVVFSNQIFTIEREPSSPCTITGATLRAPQAYDYLQQAAAAGAKIIFRIYPSPGNFEDWYLYQVSDPPVFPVHDLEVDPVGPSFDDCYYYDHRSAQDIADEMIAIHNYNASHDLEEFGFEAANEPNVEFWPHSYWYTDDGPGGSIPDRQDPEAWDDMGMYFGAIYDAVHAETSEIRVLTPPMAQSAYAEAVDTFWCKPMYLRYVGMAGYEWMIYNDNYYTIPKHDGIDWHNYWDYTRETYGPCWDNRTGGMHVSYYFPQSLKNWINSHPLTQLHITEADLLSPTQVGPGIDPILPNKDGTNAEVAADSIREFFAEEHTGQWAPPLEGVTSVSWLLNDNTGCESGDPPCDHPWHAAYLEQYPYMPRLWFWLWMTEKEEPH